MVVSKRQRSDASSSPTYLLGNAHLYRNIDEKSRKPMAELDEAHRGYTCPVVPLSGLMEFRPRNPTCQTIAVVERMSTLDYRWHWRLLVFEVVASRRHPQARC